MIWGYHHFRKHPYIYIYIHTLYITYHKFVEAHSCIFVTLVVLGVASTQFLSVSRLQWCFLDGVYQYIQYHPWFCIFS